MFDSYFTELLERTIMNTMTTHEGKMWNLIGALGWVESGHDYEAIENLLLQQDDDTVHSLREFANERMGDLYERVDNYEDEDGNERVGNYGGDDSYGDMLAHVVGMGKLTFDAVMADPRRLNEIKFVENFLYALPHDTAYAREERTLGFHQEQASNGLKELQRIRKAAEDDTDLGIMMDLTRRLLELKAGNLVVACDGFIGTTGNSEIYGRYMNWELNDRHAMFSNILYDAARKLIKH